MDGYNFNMYVSIFFIYFVLLTVLLGAFVLVGDLWNPLTQSWDLSGVGLLRHQDFWFIVGMTVL